jgi:peptidoglycan/LPS O-acetylase OafA/YrhL
LLAPYWVGVGLTYGVMAAIAWRQVSVGGGGFGSHFTDGITISQYSKIHVDGGVAFASIALLPRLWRAEWFFAPQLALWFVGLLAQYYVLFPVLFFVMRRIGVLPFLVLTFAITVGANWWIVHQYGVLELKFATVTGWAPFRLIEFTSGMAIGWLIASPERHRALAVARNPMTIVAALVAGFAAHTTGDLLIGRWGAGYWQSVALPLLTLGLAMLALPLLVKPPSRVDLAMPVRALTSLGVMSYAVLIVSDAMRLVASQVRLEGASDAAWWTFLVVVYVPVSVLIAWPMAHLLGLMPKRRRAEAVPAPYLRIEPLPTPARAFEPAEAEATA